ncbi:glycosyltransferase family 2 protein [Pseudobutyrivibrio ruminis]|uniref:glycosyltransferase family 2 protein n=1 Tax=Pseudobutyrivibrio ruminis TaxID=46206 RepID=UPI0003FAA5FD|nr:glycosyltransferase [Pseudobutyrivibrio ruminis]
MNDKISVIVPVYNVKDCLGRCIESVISQTYQNWELLLIDDGATDGSGELCDQYEQIDYRIKVYHQKNQGVSVARNRGIDLARGEYICFIDSDDSIETEMFEKLKNAIVHDSCDFVMCGFKRIYDERIENQIYPESILHGSKEIGMFIQNNYLKWLISSPCGRLYKRSLIDKLRYDESMKLGEDLHFNIRYFQKCNTVTVIESPLYLYYDYGNSLTHRYIKGNYEAICVIYVDTINYLISISDLDSVDFKNINYKLFSFCVSFMSQNIGCDSFVNEIKFIKQVCENENLNIAISDLPDVGVIYRIYIWALKHKLVAILWVLSMIKYYFNDKR